MVRQKEKVTKRKMPGGMLRLLVSVSTSTDSIKLSAEKLVTNQENGDKGNNTSNCIVVACDRYAIGWLTDVSINRSLADNFTLLCFATFPRWR